MTIIDGIYNSNARTEEFDVDVEGDGYNSNGDDYGVKAAYNADESLNEIYFDLDGDGDYDVKYSFTYNDDGSITVTIEMDGDADGVFDPDGTADTSESYTVYEDQEMSVAGLTITNYGNKLFEITTDSSFSDTDNDSTNTLASVSFPETLNFVVSNNYVEVRTVGGATDDISIYYTGSDIVYGFVGELSSDVAGSSEDARYSDFSEIFAELGMSLAALILRITMLCYQTRSDVLVYLAEQLEEFAEMLNAVSTFMSMVNTAMYDDDHDLSNNWGAKELWDLAFDLGVADVILNTNDYPPTSEWSSWSIDEDGNLTFTVSPDSSSYNDGYLDDNHSFTIPASSIEDMFHLNEIGTHFADIHGYDWDSPDGTGNAVSDSDWLGIFEALHELLDSFYVSTSQSEEETTTYVEYNTQQAEECLTLGQNLLSKIAGLILAALRMMMQ